MTNLKKLIIALPAFNEEETIKEVIAALPRAISGITEIKILVIDDGSTDSTSEIVKNIPGVTIIKHQKNRGVGAAFRSAVNFALKDKGDILVTIDADGQFQPSEIANLIQPLLNNQAEMVTGSRFTLTQSQKRRRIRNLSLIKYWGNLCLVKIVNWLVQENYSDVSCGFRAYLREALLRLNLFGNFTYTHEVFLDLSFKGLRIKEVPVSVKYFKNRKSRVAGNIWLYGWRTLNIIFNTLRDFKPVKVFGRLGAIIFLLGLGFDLFLFSHWLKTGSFSPYIFTGFIGGFLNALGLLLFVVSWLADMLNRLRRNQEELLYFEKIKIYGK